MSRIKIRFLMSLILVLTTAVVASTVSATAANAEEESGIYYPVNFTNVCESQGHFGAFYFADTPWTWRCYDPSFPVGVSLGPGLDIEKWCMARYPGTRATLLHSGKYVHTSAIPIRKKKVYSAWDWRCFKKHES